MADTFLDPSAAVSQLQTFLQSKGVSNSNVSLDGNGHIKVVYPANSNLGDLGNVGGIIPGTQITGAGAGNKLASNVLGQLGGGIFRKAPIANTTVLLPDNLTQGQIAQLEQGWNGQPMTPQNILGQARDALSAPQNVMNQVRSTVGSLTNIPAMAAAQARETIGGLQALPFSLSNGVVSSSLSVAQSTNLNNIFSSGVSPQQLFGSNSFALNGSSIVALPNAAGVVPDVAIGNFNSNQRAIQAAMNGGSVAQVQALLAAPTQNVGPVTNATNSVTHPNMQTPNVGGDVNINAALGQSGQSSGGYNPAKFLAELKPAGFVTDPKSGAIVLNLQPQQMENIGAVLKSGVTQQQLFGSDAFFLDTSGDRITLKSPLAVMDPAGFEAKLNQFVKNKPAIDAALNGKNAAQVQALLATQGVNPVQSKATSYHPSGVAPTQKAAAAGIAVNS